MFELQPHFVHQAFQVAAADDARLVDGPFLVTDRLQHDLTLRARLEERPVQKAQAVPTDVARRGQDRFVLTHFAAGRRDVENDCVGAVAVPLGTSSVVSHEFRGAIEPVPHCHDLFLVERRRLQNITRGALHRRSPLSALSYLYIGTMAAGLHYCSRGPWPHGGRSRPPRRKTVLYRILRVRPAKSECAEAAGWALLTSARPMDDLETSGTAERACAP